MMYAPALLASPFGDGTERAVLLVVRRELAIAAFEYPRQRRDLFFLDVIAGHALHFRLAAAELLFHERMAMRGRDMADVREGGHAVLHLGDGADDFDVGDLVRQGHAGLVAADRQAARELAGHRLG